MKVVVFFFSFVERSTITPRPGHTQTFCFDVVYFIVQPERTDTFELNSRSSAASFVLNADHFQSVRQLELNHVK